MIRRLMTLLMAGLFVTLAACGGGTAVATEDATNDMNTLLLGDAWIGSGTYELLASATAVDPEDGFTVWAARIQTGVGEEVTLFWRRDNPGLLIGDATTRLYSDWGADVGDGSPVDQLVESAKSSDVGAAVIAAVGG